MSNGMQIMSDVNKTRHAIFDVSSRGSLVGVVPTMGALHAGHVSLVELAKSECDFVATSIFVNPTQFGPNEDLSKYPRTLESDVQLLKQAGCDLIYTPTPETMYRKGFSTFVEPPKVGQLWEGACRPGHFRGVATVVLKLFQVLPGNRAYFGLKDYQQVRVIEEMVRDLDIPMDIVRCPTIREPDGLAMSSRNRYLSPEERIRALGLWNALQAASKLIVAGNRDASEIELAMHQPLQQVDAAIDYCKLVDADSLEWREKLNRRSVAIIAARIGSTRLIDNQVFEDL